MVSTNCKSELQTAGLWSRQASGRWLHTSIAANHLPASVTMLSQLKDRVRNLLPDEVDKAMLLLLQRGSAEVRLELLFRHALIQASSQGSWPSADPARAGLGRGHGAV
jgi:hypothetical protein